MSAHQPLRSLFPYLLSLAALLLFGWAAYWALNLPYDGLLYYDSTGLVSEIDPKGPAYGLLRTGDTILSVDGVSTAHIVNLAQGKWVGDEIKLVVERDEHIINLSLRLGKPTFDELATRFVPLLAALFFWAAGFWVVAFAPVNQARTLFALFSQASAMLLITGGISSYGLTWASRLFNTFLWFIGPLSVHFHLYFPQNQNWRWQRLLTSLLYIFATLGSLPYLFIDLLELRTLVWHPVLITCSRLFLGLNLLLTAVIVLYTYQHTTTPGTRGKIRIVVLGCILAVFPIFILTLLPDALLRQPLIPYSYAFILLIAIPITYGYAIFRHRLIEIEKHVNRGAAIILVYTSLGFFYLILSFILNNWVPLAFQKTPLINTLLVLTLATIFVPLRRQMQIFVDKIFYGGWYDYRSAISEITQGLEQTNDLPTLAKTLSLRLVDTLHLEDTCVFLRDLKGDFSIIEVSPVDKIHSHTERIFPVLPRTSLSYLLNIGAVEKNSLRMALQEISLTPEELQLLNSEQVHLWVPVIGHGQVLGLLALGPKYGGDVFSSEDMDILRTVARQIGPVIENLHLLTQLRAYAAELEERVAARTAELHDAKTRVEAILASVGDGVTVIDLDGNIRTLNSALEEQSGFSVEELTGNTFLALLDETNDATILNDMQEALNRGEVWNGELLSRRKGQGSYPIQLTIAPVRDQNGQIVSYVGSQRDITRQKELNRLKDQFVSDVSHELRTPTTNISLYLDLLESAPADKQLKYIHVLKEQAFLLRKLVEDILDLSRLAVGKSQKHDFTEVDLNQLVEGVVTAHQPQASSHHIDLHFSADNTAAVLGDASQLSRVITNLVSNAVRYTQQGEVRIRTYQNNGCICLEVGDTGIGIAPEDQPHLFERFYRGIHARQSKIHGTGLGLAIAKEIVGLHGGHIEFQSVVGKGSTFRVWLPASQDKACQAKPS